MVSLKSLFRRSIPRAIPTAALKDNSSIAFYWDNGALTPIKSGFFDTAALGAYGRIYRELDSSDPAMAEAYVSCEWAFRALNVRTQKVASVLNQGYYQAANGDTLDRHPIKAAMEESYRLYHLDVFKSWAFNLGLFGEAYLQIVRAAIGLLTMPRALRSLTPLAIEPYFVEGRIDHYDYSADDGYYTIAPQDIIFDFLYNPLDEKRGLSLLAVALNSINIDRSIVFVTKNYLKNNARPGIIFTPKSTSLSDPDWDRLNTELKEQVRGPNNAGKPLVMGFPMDVTTVQPPSLEDQQILTDEKKRRICSAIGVPTALVDYTDMAFQLSAEQARNFYDLTVIPAAQDIARIINTALMPLFDRSGTQFIIPVDEVMNGLEDPTDRQTASANQLQGGYLTMNEARQKHQLPKVDGGDVFFFPANVVPIPVDQLANAGALIAASQPQPFGGAAPGLPPGGKPPAGLPPVMRPPAGNLPVQRVPFNQKPVAPVRSASIGTPGAYAILSVADDPLLTDFQAKLKASMPDVDGIRWTPPADFHVTLVYATLISDDQLHAVIDDGDAFWGTSPATITTQPLTTFDQDTQQVLILPVEKSAELARLQALIYERFTGWLGFEVPMSEYSTPEAWNPHITLAYVEAGIETPNLTDTFALKPQTIEFSRGDFQTVNRYPVLKKQSLPADELAAWKRKALKSGASKPFVAYVLPKHVEAFIREELTGAETKAAITAIFEDAAGVLDTAVMKDYADTRSKFVSEMLRIIGAGQADDVSRQKFSGEMKSALRRFGLQAFQDGLAEGSGSDHESFSEDELTIFKAWNAETADYISGLSSELYKEGGITEAEVETRAGLWANKSLDDIYYAGYRIGGPDKKATWKIDGAKEHCDTCLGRDGQTKTMDEWGQIGFPRDRRLDCGGWQCTCGVFDSAGNEIGFQR